MRRLVMVGLVALGCVVIAAGLTVAQQPNTSPIVTTIADCGPLMRQVPPLIDVNGDDSAIIGDCTGTHLGILDLANGRTVETMALIQQLYTYSSLPVVAVDPPEHRLYALCESAPPMSGIEAVALDAYDTLSGRRVRSIPLGNNLDTAEVVVDPRADRVLVLLVTSAAMSIEAFDERHTRLMYTTVVQTGSSEGWANPARLVLAVKADHMFIPSTIDDRVSVLDTRTSRVLRTLAPSASYPYRSTDGMTPLLDDRNKRLYTTSQWGQLNTAAQGGSHTLLNVFDSFDGRLLSRTAIYSYTYFPTIVLAERTRRLYVLSAAGINVLNASTGRSITTLKAPFALNEGFFRVAFDQQRQRLVIGDYATETVAAWDDVSDRLLYAVNLHQHSFLDDLGIVSRTGRILVMTGISSPRPVYPDLPNSLIVLDGRTGMMQKVVRLGFGEGHIIVSGRTQRALAVVPGQSIVTESTGWGWIPSWVRRWLPFLPSATRSHTVTAHLTVIDTSRL